MPKKPAPAAAAAPPPPQEDPGYTLIPGTDWEPPKMLIRPADQLPGLSEKELAEEVGHLTSASATPAARADTRRCCRCAWIASATGRDSASDAAVGLRRHR